MKIGEFKTQFGEKLPDDVSVEYECGNIAPEGEGFILGWDIYTCWQGKEGMLGIHNVLAEDTLRKLTPKSVLCMARILGATRQRYEEEY